MAKPPIYSISTISLLPKSQYYNTKDTTIRYPIFHFENNPEVERVINKTLREAVLERMLFDGENPDTISTEQMLRLVADEGLADLTLDTVTYSTSAIICFSISIEHDGGAHPNNWTQYFAFDLYEGRRLTITELIKPKLLSTFFKTVAKRQHEVIKEFQQSARQSLKKKEFSQEEYDDIIEETEDDCFTYFDPHRFCLSSAGIAIIVDCDFPHAIRSLEDHGNVFFSAKEMHRYLLDLYLEE